MEELVPFLFFILIALVQLVKFLFEKSTKAKQQPIQPGEKVPSQKGSALEELFNGLAEKLELQPQPTPLPDWPEGIKRPDYRQEMEEYEDELEYIEEPVTETIPMPEPPQLDHVAVKAIKKTVAFQAPPQVASSIFAGLSNIRVPAVPLMKSNRTGSIDFDLKDRKVLKQAIIANIIFSQPRAYDCAFDNTVAK